MIVTNSKNNFEYYTFEVTNMLDGDCLDSLVEKYQPDLIVPEIESIRTERFYEYENRGIKVIVLYKEGLAPLGSMSDRVKKILYSNKQFHGDLILFYNKFIRDCFLFLS